MQEKRFNLQVIPLICTLLLVSSVTLAEAKKNAAPSYQTVQLVPAYAGELSYNPELPYRWRDCVGNQYSADYIDTYNYTQAAVTVSIQKVDTTFHGTLEAHTLKPNFAYQLKLVGYPGTEANEKLGFIGRWWQETWNGSDWVNGRNLNTKGNGSSPNPNDLAYLSTKDTPDATRPTGLKYRYTGYLVFDYFITDHLGDASLEFEADSSYHVLFRTNQHAPTAYDGSVKAYSFDPDPSQPAYDTNYDLAEGGVFGEWERLPVGGILVSEGKYDCKIFLTEESFHEKDINAGSWAAALEGAITFQIKSEPTKGPNKPHPHT